MDSDCVGFNRHIVVARRATKTLCKLFWIWIVIVRCGSRDATRETERRFSLGKSEVATESDRSLSGCPLRGGTPKNVYFRSSEYFLTRRGCSSGTFWVSSRFLTWRDISDEMRASCDTAEQVAVCLGTRICRLLRCIFATTEDQDDPRIRRRAELRFLNVGRH